MLLFLNKPSAPSSVFEFMETPMWFLAITCCLSEDSHLIQDAVLLKCGGRACAKCAPSLSKCSHCKVKHESHNDNILMRDSLVEIFIEKNYSSIIEHLDMQYRNKHQEFRSSGRIVKIILRNLKFETQLQTGCLSLLKLISLQT
jgi:hypothetical protein